MIFVKVAATDAEITECLRIRHDVFVVEQRVPAHMERDEHDRAAIHFLAVEGGEAVGAARALLKDEGASAKIGCVAVAAKHRGRGVGKMLILAAESAREFDQSAKFLLDSQVHAMRFYERLGYEAFGEAFLDAGIAHRHMAKMRATKRN